MTDNNHKPNPRDLNLNPQLAALAILDAALEMTIFALVAAHPGIQCPDRPYWVEKSPSDSVAQLIVTLANPLGIALHDYRNTIASESPPNLLNSNSLQDDDEIPF